MEHSRTTSSGQALVKAICADLAAFGCHLAMLVATLLPRRSHGSRQRRTVPAPAARRKRRWRLLSMLTSLTVTILFAALALAAAMLWALHDLPVSGRMAAQLRPSLLIEAADGRPLGRTGPLTGTPMTRGEIPDVLVNAVLSIEDRRFYRHAGIDPFGIVRALRANYAAGEIVEGGSTITQQLVKLELVGRERTMARKLREALTALWVDFRLSKDEILVRYLNRIYLGAGAYGVAAAARIYFDKKLSDLTLAEAAMLAGLIQAPSEYSPIRNLPGARQRAARVLDAMVENGVIDASAASAAKAAPVTPKAPARAVRAESWFADWIAKHEFPKVAGGDGRSVRVRTTLVPDLQEVAERVVGEALRGATRRGATQAALVAMRPDGAVVAMVGGRDYDRSQFNRAVDARRQPGSAFKLFVYLAALRSGYSIDDVIDASPIRIRNWQPENFGGRRYGTMTLEQAFAQSVNTAAVRLASEVGLPKVVAAARDLGIDAPLPEVPSLALGTAEVTLLDLTGAFAAVRAGRTRLEPFGIVAYGPEDGGLRTLGAPAGHGEVLAEREDLLTLLRGVVTRGTARGAGINGFAAGKTGTSQNYRDAWFIGFNEQLVVGVWVGNDDHRAMKGVTGGMLPAQIWKRFVAAAGAAGRASSHIAAAPTPIEATSGGLPTASTEGRAASDAVFSFRTADDTASALCDVEACAEAYRSFRAADCTYQPVYGRRRLCAISPPLRGAARVQVPATPVCNVAACERRYRSFDPADCTYQPYGGGPRRFCEAD